MISSKLSAARRSATDPRCLADDIERPAERKRCRSESDDMNTASRPTTTSSDNTDFKAKDNAKRIRTDDGRSRLSGQDVLNRSSHEKSVYDDDLDNSEEMAAVDVSEQANVPLDKSSKKSPARTRKHRWETEETDPSFDVPSMSSLATDLSMTHVRRQTVRATNADGDVVCIKEEFCQLDDCLDLFSDSRRREGLGLPLSMESSYRTGSEVGFGQLDVASNALIPYVRSQNQAGQKVGKDGQVSALGSISQFFRLFVLMCFFQCIM